MKKYYYFLILFIFISCNSKTDGVKSGTFELYENDSLIGYVYRVGNYQIEDYPDNTELIARIDHQTDSTYFLKGVEKNQDGIDSIIWLNHYREIAQNKYKIVATPYNSDIEYKYEGVLLKVSNEVNGEYLKRLRLLNKK
ncbi:hypothetical protein M4I21_03900 [Cellulophaga sp. 20_2_10]|uniref:hypothetical protein n=1 Tax=Cellulophaga sp. 20_2_10 TaxID=2942476 RepID=UPI00201A8D53|nr:hypothetical protein [Cellulophaga sp. 20_2_10]MCL5244936.1 hypothetical protein [Cellulophaga sp. 20_2_10]